MTDTPLRSRNWFAPKTLDGLMNRSYLKSEGFSDAVVGDRRWRVFSSWDPKRRFLIQVGEQREARDEIATRIGRNLLAPLVFALLVLGVLVFLSVSRATRPLANVHEQVARRDPENLQPIAVDDCPAEVVPLVDALNRLFGRVTRSIDNERRFTADAAHELRTPIAALRVQAQVARAAADDHERQRALDNVIVGCDRATHLVEQLLTLARLDPAYVRHQPEPCDLRAVAKAAIGEIAPRAVAKDVDIELDEGPPTFTPGDAGLLAILIRNLVDNAVRYGPSRTTVRVHIDPAGRSTGHADRHGPRAGRAGRGPAAPRRPLLPRNGHGRDRDRARALDREAHRGAARFCRELRCGAGWSGAAGEGQVRGASGHLEVAPGELPVEATPPAMLRRPARQYPRY
jgi:two-component system sensor histidine kinase QseC